MDDPHGHQTEDQNGDTDDEDPEVPTPAGQVHAGACEHDEQHQLDRNASIRRRKEDVDHVPMVRSPARIGTSSQLSSGGRAHE